MALPKHDAYWTYDEEAAAYYFAPVYGGPTRCARQVEAPAVLDIAVDGTLAGIEICPGLHHVPPPRIVEEECQPSEQPPRTFRSVVTSSGQGHGMVILCSDGTMWLLDADPHYQPDIPQDWRARRELRYEGR
jgi:uncharacterized protein YuzE